MNPEAQRIAIAEACPELVEWHDGIPYWKGCWSGFGEGNEQFAEFRPHADLYAMHEAEKLLTARHRATYVYWLNAGYAVGDAEDTWLVATTTASQRAEAFLRTLGKWEE
jgi:hypothetical protein